MSKVVGSIDGYDVIYVEGKNLTVTQDGSIIQLGCLTTTRENCEAIIKEVNKINKPN